MSTRTMPDETERALDIAERHVFGAIERGDRQTRKWLNGVTIAHDMNSLQAALARTGRDIPPEEWVRKYLRPDGLPRGKR